MEENWGGGLKDIYRIRWKAIYIACNNINAIVGANYIDNHMRHHLLIFSLLCLIPVKMFSQQKRVYNERKPPSLCSSSVTMLKGGEFVYERGCEENSYICFGTWFKDNKSVRLVPFVNFSYDIGFKVDSILKKDSIPKIIVYDVDNIDITDKMLFTYIDPIINQPTWLDISASRIASMKGRILVYTLQQIFLRQFEFYNSLNNDIFIHLSIKGDYIYNGNSKWEVPRYLEYTIEGNCLKDLTNTFYCSE